MKITIEASGARYTIHVDKLIRAGFVTVEGGEAPQMVRAKPASPLSPPNIAAAACKLWETHWGEGSGWALGIKRVAKAFGPLVRAGRTEQEVLLAWARYLKESERKFQSPEAFARRYAQYAAQPAPEKSLADRLAEKADKEAVAGLK